MDRDAFLRAIDANPDDPHRVLVYADYLDEQGDAARAAALRWAVNGGLRPVFRPAVTGPEDWENLPPVQTVLAGWYWPDPLPQSLRLFCGGRWESASRAWGGLAVAGPPQPA